jgi:lysophospholipase L1-like esterase
MNQGIGGNRILHDVRGDSGLRRFDRDVLAQPGVSHVIVLLGINDIRNRYGRQEKRQAVNAWIRNSGAFDAVIDFEAALRDPGHPTRMLPEYDCGDHLHPSDRGYLRMGEIIDLSLFD